MATDYLLTMKHLKKSFSGVTVLKDVHLNVRAGSVHALMGENGAGKSTLMKCLFGIYKQDTGEFFLDGEEFNFTDPKHALEKAWLRERGVYQEGFSRHPLKSLKQGS